MLYRAQRSATCGWYIQQGAATTGAHGRHQRCGKNTEHDTQKKPRRKSKREKMKREDFILQHHF